jgi:hypothetical protein
MSKNEKTLQAFAEYCRSHHEERFWQALRNFSAYNFIGVSNDKESWTDTFYWEGLND